MILAGRRINDRLGAHVAETVVKLMLQSGIGVCHSRVLVLGLAFKEKMTTTPIATVPRRWTRRDCVRRGTR